MCHPLTHKSAKSSVILECHPPSEPFLVHIQFEGLVHYDSLLYDTEMSALPVHELKGKACGCVGSF